MASGQGGALPVHQVYSPKHDGKRPANYAYSGTAGSGSKTRAGTIALSYMACAILLIFFNKAALSTYHFPYPDVITLFQLIVSNVLLYACKRLNWVSFADGPGAAAALTASGLPSLATLKKGAPLAAAYLFYMVTSMASLRGVNLPMYTTLRRTTAAFTLAAEWDLQARTLSGHRGLVQECVALCTMRRAGAAGGKVPSRRVLISVGLMVLGALVAGARDLQFQASGYGLVLLCNVATAVYLTAIGRIGRRTGLNSFGLMWLNGVLCAPALLGYSALSGKLRLALEFPEMAGFGFRVVLGLSCVLAFALNYTIFLNTAVNSALTQTVCGSVKDVVVVALGFRSFGGVPFDLLNAAGIALGFAGSALYAHCRLTGGAGGGRQAAGAAGKSESGKA